MYMRNIIIVVLMALLFCIGTAFASSKAEYEKRASLLAEFLHTGGRVTVAHSLGKFKINDASLAEKGFTSSYFAEIINSKYKESTGIDIAAGTGDVDKETLNLLKTLLSSSKKKLQTTIWLSSTPPQA